MARLGSRIVAPVLQILVFLLLSAGFIMIIRDRILIVDWTFRSLTWFWPGLVVAILFIPLNWCLEVVKFQRLLGRPAWPVQRQIVRSVLSGITVSMFLPNRMGEFAGRLLFFSREERVTALSATLIGSMLQTSWIAGFGVVVLVVNGQWHALGQVVQLPGVPLVSSLLAIALVAIAVAFYPRIRGYLKSMADHFRNILGGGAVTSAGAWALLRYVTYCSQFVLLLYFVGLASPIRDAVVFVISFFFLQTVLPLPPALGWIARIQLAVILGGVLSIHPMQAIVASLILWLLNLVIPGLLGGFFLLNQNLYKHLKNVRTAYLPD